MVPGVAHCGDAEASEANARLIAATPEMHEALCSLVRQVEEFRSWDEKDWPAALAALSAHAQAARGLIARAEGRES